MATHVPKLPTTGWTRFDFTLMTSATNERVLVSDDIVRDYLAYLATCRQSHMRPMNFATWLVASPGAPRSAAVMSALA